MKQLITPTDKEIQAHMDINGEVFLKVEDRNDGYYRLIFVNPDSIKKPLQVGDSATS